MELHERIPSLLPKEDLENLYFTKMMSTTGIAMCYGIFQLCLYNLFARYGLKPRTLKEAMMLRKKPSTRYKRLRLRILNMLGGKCVHCGCDDSRLIEIHHKLGDGRKERRKVGNNRLWYNIVMGRRSVGDLELCCRPCHSVEEVKRLYGVESFHVVWSEK